MQFDLGQFHKNLGRANIVNQDPDFGSFFNDAAKLAAKKVETKITEVQEQIKNLEKVLASQKNKIGSTPFDSDYPAYEELEDHIFYKHRLEMTLTSIYEMQVISIYKSFEIEIKLLLTSVYPETKTKGFFNWDKLTGFLKSKKITHEDLNGFSELNELRKLNNSIKHSSTLSKEARSIPEFKELKESNTSSLKKFIARVLPLINAFYTSLTEEIYRERYEFSNDRLAQMADGFRERMNQNTLDRFIKRLKP